MKLRSLKWPCAGVANHMVTEAIFDVSDINAAISVANSKVNFINVHNPGGIVRPQAVIKNRIIAGKLADKAVLEMINTMIVHWGLQSSISVEEYDHFRNDNFQNPDPYDLELRNLVTGNVQSIEVRSSFCYKMAPVQKIVEKLSVYGWYTSANKPIEPPRDWYFQVIFYLRPSDIMPENEIKIDTFEDQLASGSITGYVVGGASQQLLHTNGIFRTDQDGASYRAIYPVCKAADCWSMLNAVLGRN